MVIGISDAQLAAMRAQVALMLPDTAIIERESRVSDGAGGWTPSWASPTGGTVDCRLDPLRMRDRGAISEALGRPVTPMMWQLTLPYDAPIAAGDRVVIDTRNHYVIQLDDGHSWNVSRRAIVEETR
jgi:hypothetical protein